MVEISGPNIRNVELQKYPIKNPTYASKISAWIYPIENMRELLRIFFLTVSVLGGLETTVKRARHVLDKIITVGSSNNLQTLSHM